VDVLIHGGNRSVPKTDRVPVAVAQRARELGPSWVRFELGRDEARPTERSGSAKFHLGLAAARRLSQRVIFAG
jgi:hypothetical protein